MGKCHVEPVYCEVVRSGHQQWTKHTRRRDMNTVPSKDTQRIWSTKTVKLKMCVRDQQKFKSKNKNSTYAHKATIPNTPIRQYISSTFAWLATEGRGMENRKKCEEINVEVTKTKRTALPRPRTICHKLSNSVNSTLCTRGRFKNKEKKGKEREKKAHYCKSQQMINL